MINEKKHSEFLGVCCLHCRRPIPLYAGSHAAAPDVRRGVVVAWCGTCGKESPYLTERISRYEGALPANFRAHAAFARAS
jgi:hypothetical protein